MPIPVRIAPFLVRGCPLTIYAGLARFSPGCPPDRGRLHTCYSPVRRSPAAVPEDTAPLPLDLHVLSLPLAFILSQDQTLRCFYIFSFFFFSLSVRTPCIYYQDPLTGNSLYIYTILCLTLSCYAAPASFLAVSCGIMSLSSLLPLAPSFHPREIRDSGCKSTATFTTMQGFVSQEPKKRYITLPNRLTICVIKKC